MKQKILLSICTILIIFNFIFYSTCSAGLVDDINPDMNELATPSNDAENSFNDAYDEGDGSMFFDSGGPLSVIVALFMGFIDIMFLFPIDLILSYLTDPFVTEGTTSADSFADLKTIYGNDYTEFLTIEKILFNRIPLLNIDYFSFDGYKVDTVEYAADTNNTLIKDRVATMYYAIQKIALMLSMVVLIYIGIRMAISSVASDQARYKKMLIGWVEGIFILFLTPYVLGAIFTFNELLINIFAKLELSLVKNNGEVKTYGVFEGTVRQSFMSLLIHAKGIKFSLYSVEYFILLFTEVRFLYTYIKRFFSVGFMIVISPIITVTYPIDKVNDDKAQVFHSWVCEMITLIFIQPLHCLVYLIFVFSANAIASQNTMLGIILILCLSEVEHIVVKIFNVQMETLGHMDDKIKFSGLGQGIKGLTGGVAGLIKK